MSHFVSRQYTGRARNFKRSSTNIQYGQALLLKHSLPGLVWANWLVCQPAEILEDPPSFLASGVSVKKHFTDVYVKLLRLEASTLSLLSASSLVCANLCAIEKLFSKHSGDRVAYTVSSGDIQSVSYTEADNVILPASEPLCYLSTSHVQTQHWAILSDSPVLSKWQIQVHPSAVSFQCFSFILLWQSVIPGFLNTVTCQYVLQSSYPSTPAWSWNFNSQGKSAIIINK